MGLNLSFAIPAPYHYLILYIVPFGERNFPLVTRLTILTIRLFDFGREMDTRPATTFGELVHQVVSIGFPPGTRQSLI
jgi:hypothetical protein